MLSLETKYIVKVEQATRGMKPSKEALESLKGVIGAKLISRMKKEYVVCPVKNGHVSFIDCFACVSFIRRIKGEVHCAGVEFKIKER